MAKKILIILTLIFIVGCDEKRIDVAPKIEKVNNITKNEVEKNATVCNNVESNKSIVKAVIPTIQAEFVPAHIANSTIEVVPH